MVSVLIPSYNRKDLIARTIDSILNQNCEFDFELIIGDDFSSDGVRDVLIKYQQNNPNKIKLIFHEENIGLGANWAYCVKEARGKYLANCDNDDYWHNENKLNIQVEFLENNKDIGVCHTYYRNAGLRRTCEMKIDNSRINEPLYIAIANLRNFECCNSSILYRAELIDQHINLDDYIKYRFVLQDWNTWVILAYYTKFHCIPISTTTVAIHNTSITRNTDYNTLENRLIKQESTSIYINEKFPEAILYSKNLYEIYINKMLLNLCYVKYDHKKAKEISLRLNMLGFSNIKTVFSKYFVLFYNFCIFKNFRAFLKRG